MSLEMELKLEVAPEFSDKLRALPLLRRVEPDVACQASVYFDTRRKRLRRHGWTLRVRESRGRFVQTIKRSEFSAGLFEREEWEEVVHGLRPDSDAIAWTPLAALLSTHQLRRLAPVVTVEVERSTWLIPAGKGLVEVAFDEGQVRAGGAHDDFHEIELELKRGEVGDLSAIARSIGRRIPVRLGVQSKAERGIALAKRKSCKAFKADPIVVDEDMTVADGVATILSSCIKQFRLNEPLIGADRDPEALHQSRVAIRRLRAALSLFKPAMEDEESVRLRAALGDFTNRLGPARDLDVMLFAVPPAERRRPVMERKRERAYAAIARMLASARFRSWMLEFVIWTHAGAWRNGKRAQQPLMTFALKRLDRLWRAIQGGAEAFDTLSVTERHQLRIDGKKMRYSLEFLEAALGRHSSQRRFAKAVENLQETLGVLNDLATARALSPTRKVRQPPDEFAPDEEQLLQASRRHLRALLRTGAYWKQEF
ncbi:CHAD domain-containing protein [Sphingomonas alba]|uniref:CHAD domain-containing protein n=1 Tax=Sphingomonas alba TaxID=2908208 RepID=A0ABT0RN27_9SPHN|nr:CHAD domain-containing protein [Sphingomonas alba]MCL6684051.1 CHAD domain-containing protein [Sphingomonas alba]